MGGACPVLGSHRISRWEELTHLLNPEKVDQCSPGPKRQIQPMDAGLGLARPLESIALFSQMSMTRERCLEEIRGAGGIRTSYVTCKTQCEK